MISVGHAVLLSFRVMIKRNLFPVDLQWGISPLEHKEDKEHLVECKSDFAVERSNQRNI